MAYRNASYQRAAVVTTMELAANLTNVMDRLYARLICGLGLGDPLRA
jgi:hypothetical protein